MQGSARRRYPDQSGFLNLIGEMKKELENDRICGH